MCSLNVLLLLFLAFLSSSIPALAQNTVSATPTPVGNPLNNRNDFFKLGVILGVSGLVVLVGFLALLASIFCYAGRQRPPAKRDEALRGLVAKEEGWEDVDEEYYGRSK